MPRIFRILPETGVFHILTRGNNQGKVFIGNKDHLFYLNLLKEYKSEHNFMLYHYCLMPNHVHLVLETTPKTDLPMLMKQINLKYFYHFKKRYSYCGHLWQGRFKSLLIEKDKYLIACGRYIELNPVRARIVNSPEKYPYSSFKFYAQGIKDSILNINPLYVGLGKTNQLRQANYRKLFEEEIRVNLNLRFFGSDGFIRDMERKFRINNFKERRGRPFKVNK